MPELIRPRLSVAASVRSAARTYGDDAQVVYSTDVAGLADDQLGAYVDRLLGDEHEDAPRPEGYVPSTHLWWVEGDEFLGRLHLRHRLNTFLRETGGHVGYYVVPSSRGRGHATAMLAASLPVALAKDIECLLLTCDLDNVASAKVIEANGGLFCDERHGKRRYWVPTG